MDQGRAAPPAFLAGRAHARGRCGPSRTPIRRQYVDESDDPCVTIKANQWSTVERDGM